MADRENHTTWRRPFEFTRNPPTSAHVRPTGHGRSGAAQGARRLTHERARVDGASHPGTAALL